MIVGYCAGCFDLFHVGHLNMLRVARNLCDKLIVAVSTDELVKKMKHRVPTISLRDRMEIVRNIKGVDAVIPQRDYDKHEAWKRLKFNVVFIGDDHYSKKDPYHKFEKKLKKEGVDIIYIPYTNGISTSLIRNEKKS